MGENKQHKVVQGGQRGEVEKGRGGSKGEVERGQRVEEGGGEEGDVVQNGKMGKEEVQKWENREGVVKKGRGEREGGREGGKEEDVRVFNWGGFGFQEF